MKFLTTVLILAVILGALFVAGFMLPYGPSSEMYVDIPTGTTSSGIASTLERSGIIRSRYAFLLMRRVHGGTLHAGVYRFDHPEPIGTVYGRLLHGDVSTRTLVIPEGFNLFDIANAVQSSQIGISPNFISAGEFLAAAQRNTALIADLSPHATSLEGFLFPDTYRFSPHTTPDQMVATMVKRFRQIATQIGLLAPPGSIGDASLYNVSRTVTLASLIEKEVALDSERPLVAGVFENRLAKNMPLATDPSVIYAALLDHRWRGTIYQSDLASLNPYNTYRHTGMPPGPIANPGVAALKAAMNPARTDYLYFVADAQGHSRFSVDLKEHAKQVQAHRQAQR